MWSRTFSAVFRGHAARGAIVKNAIRAALLAITAGLAIFANVEPHSLQERGLRPRVANAQVTGARRLRQIRLCRRDAQRSPGENMRP